MGLDIIIDFLLHRKRKEQAPKVLPIESDIDEIRAQIFPQDYGIKIDDRNKNQYTPNGINVYLSIKEIKKVLSHSSPEDQDRIYQRIEDICKTRGYHLGYIFGVERGIPYCAVCQGYNFSKFLEESHELKKVPYQDYKPRRVYAKSPANAHFFKPEE
jgi:hypothetical protein